MFADQEVLQLKIRLIGISPMVWRRVLVPASTNLRELHGILQVGMGWESIHLYHFEIHAVRYGSFQLQAVSPDIALDRLGLKSGAKFHYVYAMGDHWDHEVRVEAVDARQPKKSYPLCTGGAGACPPEDCGGVDGYLARRDEAQSYCARLDMKTMTEFLEDIVAADDPSRSVSDFLSDDVEMAMERMAGRKLFLDNKFSRDAVNKRFQSRAHRELMRQQLF